MNVGTKLPKILALRSSQFLRQSPQLLTRTFHVCSVSQLKEIRQEEAGGVITIKGVTIPSPREGRVIKLPNSDNKDQCTECPVCRLGPGIHIKHTDVLILQQFVDISGRQLPKNVTGLCNEQNKRMNYLIVMARHAGLLPKKLPDGTIDPTESLGWRSNNKYYDEGAIDDFLTSERRKA